MLIRFGEKSRRMSDIFRELPDKETYADYYEAIPEPECLDNISVRQILHPFESGSSYGNSKQAGRKKKPELKRKSVATRFRSL